MTQDYSSKLSLSDIKVGMQVGFRQLDNIYDTNIVMTDIAYDGRETYGTIEYIGKDLPSNIIDIGVRAHSMGTVYHGSAELDYDCEE